MKVLDMIKQSFDYWAHNFVIALPFVFSALATIVFLLPIIAIVALITLGTTSFLASSISILFSVFLGVLSFILILLATAYFSAGGFGMAFELIQKKKISLKTMDIYGKKFFVKYAKMLLVLGLIGLGIFLIIGAWVLIPIYFLGPVWTVLYIPVFIVGTLIMLLFSLAPCLLIIEDKGIKSAIRKSVKIASKNYAPLLGLTVLFGLMSGVVNLLGNLGGIVGVLIIYPVQTIAWMMFTIDKFKIRKKSLKKDNT